MKTLYNKVRNDEWEKDEIVMTITARYGTGGGNVPLIVEPICFRPEQTIKIDGGGHCVHAGIKGIQIPAMRSDKT